MSMLTTVLPALALQRLRCALAKSSQSGKVVSMIASTLDLKAFIDTLMARDAPQRAVFPRFIRRRWLASAGEACPLCATPYSLHSPRGFDFPVVSPIVHPARGGLLIADNALSCCRRCQQQRGLRDLMSIGPLPDSWRERRGNALMTSHNHLLPLPPSTRPDDFLRALRQRHILPRSRVFAAQGIDGVCFVGLSVRHGDNASIGLALWLSRQAGTLVHRTDLHAVFRVEDDAFRELIWKLIDANAWVVALACRTHARDFLDCWWPTAASPTALRLRQVGAVVPTSARRTKATAKAANSTHRRHAPGKRGAAIEQRHTAREVSLLRQAVNDQHKRHWLDGEELDATIAGRLLSQLEVAENRLAELRAR